MNLRVSYNWLREYLPGLKATPEEVAEKLSLHAFSVERLHTMAGGLDPSIVVGKIVKIEPHPKADKLRIARTVTNSDERSRTIVCGGRNIREGMLAAVALPGAKVRWHGEGEPVELQETEIRGVKSEGMICAANEIGLFDAFPHKEREILDLTQTGAQVGMSVAKALELDDTIFEVEITTNRPDAMGMIGLAREVGAIFDIKLKIKDQKLKIQTKNKKMLDVKVGVPKLCPRYMAVVMDGVKVGPSPWWLQRRLIASGVRPVSNIVDITNYVLLELGQPCHAFDCDKLVASGQKPGKKEIVVRMGEKGEKILALDGNAYELDENVLVIADAKRPVAIAGIMGGEETGVHNDTTRVVFEIANFDAIAVRHGEHQFTLASDSSTRFNKGLPVQLPEFAAARLAELTEQLAGGAAQQVVDKSVTKHTPVRASVSTHAVAQLIGADIPAAQMKKSLTALGFRVTGGAKRWSVTFPYWRTLEAGGVADIAEEVARMYGYHKLPSILPSGAPLDEPPTPQFVQEYAIKDVLRGAGFTELYTYSFVARRDIERAGFDPDRDALALANPLSSEMTHMRPWLGISMLKAVAHNEMEGKQLRFFELSAEYRRRAGNEPELPEERQKLIVASSVREERQGEHFFSIKGAAEHLAAVLGLPSLTFEKVSATRTAPWIKHYHPARVLLCKAGRDILGVVGELHPSVLKAYGIEHRVAFLEWEAKALLPLIGAGRAYATPPVYPPVKRDIAFVVSKEVEYAALYGAMVKVDSLIHDIELFDQYEGKGVPENYRSLAFHISYASPERTLTAQEADQVHERLNEMLEKKFGAKVRD